MYSIFSPISLKGKNFSNKFHATPFTQISKLSKKIVEKSLVYPY